MSWTEIGSRSSRVISVLLELLRVAATLWGMIVNKRVLDRTDDVIFLLFAQNVVAVFYLTAMRFLGCTIAPPIPDPHTREQAAQVNVSMTLYALTKCMELFTLKHVNLSSYQTALALHLPTALAFLARLAPSRIHIPALTAIACAVICIGYIIDVQPMVLSSDASSFAGRVIGLGACLASGAHTARLLDPSVPRYREGDAIVVTATLLAPIVVLSGDLWRVAKMALRGTGIRGVLLDSALLGTLASVNVILQSSLWERSSPLVQRSKTAIFIAACPIMGAWFFQETVDIWTATSTLLIGLGTFICEWSIGETRVHFGTKASCVSAVECPTSETKNLLFIEERGERET